MLKRSYRGIQTRPDVRNLVSSIQGEIPSSLPKFLTIIQLGPYNAHQYDHTIVRSLNERPTMMKKSIRILCVDDHAFLVEGLRTRFELEDDLDCVGRLASADGLVHEAKRLTPDIVLLDIDMPGPDPFEAITDLQRHCPACRVVMLSAFVRDHYISSAFKAGAWGYFSKNEEAAEIIDGIRTVAQGRVAMGSTVQQRCNASESGSRSVATPRSSTHDGNAGASMGRAKSKLDLLTDRELEVLRFIGKGHTRSEIAKLLSRSPKTIDGHREAIMQKLDVHDRGELVRYAIREGLVEA
jgi:DNA-binding NarL/FixJ family response regulator